MYRAIRHPISLDRNLARIVREEKLPTPRVLNSSPRRHKIFDSYSCNLTFPEESSIVELEWAAVETKGRHLFFVGIFLGNSRDVKFFASPREEKSTFFPEEASRNVSNFTWSENDTSAIWPETGWIPSYVDVLLFIDVIAKKVFHVYRTRKAHYEIPLT